MNRIWKRCPHCGSDDLRNEAYTNEVEREEKVLCMKCGRSASRKRKVLH